jgi:hypothetical protein
VRTFDPEAREYPSGFRHDVSLFEPIDRSVTSNFSNPIENLGWLSESAWNGLRNGSGPIHILQASDSVDSSCILFPDVNPSTQVLPNVEQSDCQVSLASYLPNCVDLLQIIGRGIQINYESFESNIQTINIENLQKAVSECLLYRVSPNFLPDSGCSGVVVWANGQRVDGTTGSGVVGF